MPARVATLRPTPLAAPVLTEGFVLQSTDPESSTPPPSFIIEKSALPGSSTSFIAPKSVSFEAASRESVPVKVWCSSPSPPVPTTNSVMPSIGLRR